MLGALRLEGWVATGGPLPSAAGTGSSILSALQDLFSITWLNRSKVEKQLQVISVLQWVLSFLVLGKLGLRG